LTNGWWRVDRIFVANQYQPSMHPCFVYSIKNRFCIPFLTFGLLFLAQLVWAQPGVQVTARVLSSDKSTIDLASAVLLQAADSSFVKAAVPDAEGLLEFAQVHLRWMVLLLPFVCRIFNCWKAPTRSPR
jgi:hypothetical protein